MPYKIAQDTLKTQMDGWVEKEYFLHYKDIPKLRFDQKNRESFEKDIVSQRSYILQKIKYQIYNLIDEIVKNNPILKKIIKM